jgi:hypothetical protein
MSSRWKLSRRLPEGSVGGKLARVSRRWQVEMPRLPAAVRGVHRGGGLPIAVQPPPLPELALLGLIVQPPRELATSKSKENQGKRLLFP